MTEFIPDLRVIVPFWPADDVCPGFKDPLGNYVSTGDWLIVATSGRAYQAPWRLAQVIKVEGAQAERFVRFDPKPEDQWTDQERRWVESGYRSPQIRIMEPYTRAEITVAQYPSNHQDQKPINRVLEPRNGVLYQGTVPFEGK
jgi:hypothetical protein